MFGLIHQKLAGLLLFIAASVSAGPVVISEFLAVNQSGLQDEDGTFSDWIEIHHPGSGVQSLSGWYLSDDPANLTRWKFPALTLQAGERILVYASGKNRTNNLARLHTNFSLAREGEFLALVESDGMTMAHQYAPYPEQFADVSYGLGAGPIAEQVTLFASGDEARLLVPTGSVPSAWRGGGTFDDRGWTNLVMGAGFNRDGRPVIGDPVETVAYQIAAGKAGNQAYGGALGMDFIVIEPVVVSALGVFDDGSDGLNRSIVAELWSRNDGGSVEDPNDDTAGAILASLSFDAAQPGALMGGSRFKPLAAPLLLAPGAYTMVAHGYGAGERNGNASDMNILNDDAGAIGFVGRSRFGAAGSFPLSVDGGPEGRYGAGTFRFYRTQDPRIRTDLESQWFDENAAAYFRMPFAVSNANELSDLRLEMAFDDGYAAYLNGVLIASNNVPTALDWDSTALTSTAVVETVQLGAALSAMQSGTNLLAIQSLNVASNDRDALLDVRLSAEIAREDRLYFAPPSAGAANGVGSYGTGLVINELHLDPAAGTDVEFIELYHAGVTSIDLSGMRLVDGIRYTFPTGVVVAAGEYVVVAANPSAFSNAFPGGSALGPFSGSLNNSGERITLEDAQTGRVDRVSYGLGAPWPVVGDAPYHSFQLVHPGLDNNLAGSWRAAAPTPGAVNANFELHPPPQVRQVRHTPLAPQSGQPVVVSCKVTDPQGVAQVQLGYQVVEPGHYLPSSDPGFATNWTAVAMTPLSNDVFQATLPGSLQTHRRLIRYRVHATDVEGSEVTLPLPSDPSLNFAYFVYDGAPAWMGADIPGQTPAVTYSTNIMNALPITHLISREQDVLDCQYNPAFNDKVYRFEGAIVRDGQVYDHVRYRIRGSASTYNTGKNKWKIRFNRGRYFKGTDDYGRPYQKPVRTLNWSALASPWNPANRGAAGLDEVLAMRLWQRAGVNAINTSYFHLRVVDDVLEQDPNSQFEGDNWGLYAALEQADRRFLDERDLPDGNTFNNHFGASSQLNQGKGQPSDRSDLFAFTGTGAEGYNRDPVQPESWWEANVDLEGYFAYRAVIEAVNHSDLRDRENSIYYHNPESGRWSVIPWDADLLYEEFDRWGPDGLQNASPLEQFRKCLIHPALNIRFQNRARELQDLLLNNDQGWKMVDEIAHLIADLDGSLGWPEIDRARWDRDPRSRAIEGPSTTTGSFYVNPYTSTRFPGEGRTLVSADFDGMTQWVKDFMVPTGFGGGQLSVLASDSAIPQKPIISYSGDPGFPSAGLRFDGSAFVAGAGGGSFQAMEWRLGQISNPDTPDFVDGNPWVYEVDTFWSSGVLSNFSATVSIPAQEVVVGATYRARVRHQGDDGRWSHWSDPVAFTATLPDAQGYRDSLVISEMMYNNPFNATQEWIELLNVGTHSLDLSPLQFVQGIRFSFADAAVTSLAPGERVVVVSDLVAFEARYGTNVVVAGEWMADDKLANEGELISLRVGRDSIVREFVYEDNYPWPEAADGLGHSLVLRAPTTLPDHGLPRSWRASVLPGGTPGGAEQRSVFSGSLSLDADSDGLTDFAEHLLGLNRLDPNDARAALTIQSDTTVTWTQQLAADDGWIELEHSPNLLSWTNGTELMVLDAVSITNGIEVNTVRLDEAMTNHYFRLRLTEIELP